jgi:hypothetical protein
MHVDVAGLEKGIHPLLKESTKRWRRVEVIAYSTDFRAGQGRAVASRGVGAIAFGSARKEGSWSIAYAGARSDNR